jgi:dTDP-4-dehydrorhamnose reductase
MKIFIAGASGLIGGHCRSVFEDAGHEVVGSHFSFPTPHTVAYNTLEPTHFENFDLVKFRPDVIVHCGALTHVDYCETHPDESFRKTVTSTLNLLETATALKAKFVYISTDYVFNGKDGPYTEEAQCHPLSVYARHKHEAEKLVLASGLYSLVLRVTNVYGTELRNKNFVMRLAESIANKKHLQLRLPLDQYATPVNARDVALAMLRLLKDLHQGIFHIASTDFINRVQLAQRIAKKLNGSDYLEILPVNTMALDQPAPRPLLGGLISAKFLSLYPDFCFSNVDDFLESLNH